MIEEMYRLITRLQESNKSIGEQKKMILDKITVAEETQKERLQKIEAYTNKSEEEEVQRKLVKKQ